MNAWVALVTSAPVMEMKHENVLLGKTPMSNMLKESMYLVALRKRQGLG